MCSSMLLYLCSALLCIVDGSAVLSVCMQCCMLLSSSLAVCLNLLQQHVASSVFSCVVQCWWQCSIVPATVRLDFVGSHVWSMVCFVELLWPGLRVDLEASRQGLKKCSSQNYQGHGMEQLDKSIVAVICTIWYTIWSVQHLFVQNALILDQYLTGCCTCTIAVQHVHNAPMQSSMLLLKCSETIHITKYLSIWCLWILNTQHQLSITYHVCTDQSKHATNELLSQEQDWFF